MQNDDSRRLLEAKGIKNVTVSGDTRFDRVTDIRNAAKEYEVVREFAGDAENVLVVGSSWEPDEDIIIPYFNSHKSMKLILAPHVVNESHISRILESLKRPAVRITQAAGKDMSAYDCLIVDTYGMLS